MRSTRENHERGNPLKICLKTEDNQENLSGDGSAQGLPEAHRHLTSSQAHNNVREVP
jgi:hypothetical protein